MGKETELFDNREEIEPPKNIVEYLKQAEDYPEGDEEPEIQVPKDNTKAKIATPAEDAKAANMRTVIKRFDDIENKVNQILLEIDSLNDLLNKNYKQCRECGGKVINE
tara:strand:- start:6060 stop:6383 length:324 start_codon:yes stop_codon:yes gene_type:complete